MNDDKDEIEETQINEHAQYLEEETITVMEDGREVAVTDASYKNNMM